MAPIVAPRICRFTVNQEMGGQQIANVLDLYVDENDVITDRTDACRWTAQDILNNWTDHILPAQVDNLSATSVDWLDLNSLSGSRGSVASTEDNVWPQEGGNTSDAAMPNVIALRVDKETTGGRGTKRGRMYIAGIAESGTASDDVTDWSALTVSSMQERLDDFYNGITDENPFAIFQSRLVVVHTVGGVYSGNSTVNGMTVRAPIGTQVRRGSLR